MKRKNVGTQPEDNTAARKKIPGPAVVCLSVLLLLALWQAGFLIVGSSLVLPSPAEVAVRLAALSVQPAFWLRIGATLVRSLSAFAVSVLLSLALGICAALVPFFRRFLSLPLTVIKSTPVVSFILLALFWFTSSAVPVFVSVLMTLPVLVSSVISGAQSVSGKLAAMARVFGLTRAQKIRYVYVPSMLPSFFSGAHTALGLSWKVVVAGEVLSLPRLSVGSALQSAKVHLETADVFAWTVAVIAASWLTECLFSLCTSKWRRQYSE